MLMDKETQIKSLKENKEALEGKVKFLQETCRRAGAQIKKLEAELKEAREANNTRAKEEIKNRELNAIETGITNVTADEAVKYVNFWVNKIFFLQYHFSLLLS